jgi:hypothetical protein
MPCGAATIAMIHNSTINGLPVKTGDLLCTTNGAEATLAGHFWRLVGSLMPGDVDHIAVYVGPGTRIVEASPLGVVAFEWPSRVWDSLSLHMQRGFLDTLYGVVSPLDDACLPCAMQDEARVAVAEFCLAQVGKPYNFNFLDPQRTDAFYCSQLAYQAYLPLGIDLHRYDEIPPLPKADRIIYPQTIWQASPSRRRAVLL